MPKKVQIKLLSQSAELLSVVNCSAGHISVLRAEAASELRPYHRALSGSQGKERFIVTVDGSEYKTEEHNLIGFGELPPHSGLTVSQYLSSFGLIEGAISGLLMSFGIEGIEQKACSALSPDEERKVRLFAATADPTKALVINEPFEPIMSSWRERVAEFLSDFARSKDGLVIVTSLSYRPDSWIDNPIITRHQVGQTLRRTIGFGAAGSESSHLMNQLRDQVRAEQNTAPPPPEEERHPQAATMSLGAAALLGSEPTDLSGADHLVRRLARGAEALSNPTAMTAIKAGGAASAGALGIWAALALLGVFSGQTPDTSNATLTARLERKHQEHPGENSSLKEPSNPTAQSDTTARQNLPAPEVKSSYILDLYPESIRVSLLDTSKGALGEAFLPQAPAPQEKSSSDTSGNFYKLLESASTDKSGSETRDFDRQEPEDMGSWNEPQSSEPEPELSGSEEEERREAIREKFLEAIRAAAERRENEEQGE